MPILDKSSLIRGSKLKRKRYDHYIYNVSEGVICGIETCELADEEAGASLYRAGSCYQCRHFRVSGRFGLSIRLDNESICFLKYVVRNLVIF